MKSIHNLLRLRLYRTQKPLIEHPPIDLLSAFAEKALSRSDREPVLEHLSHCVDCRQIVFLAAPELEGAASGAHAGTQRPHAGRWISWPVLRWGTAVACALIVVAAVRLHPGYRTPQTGVGIIEVANQANSQKNDTAVVARDDRPSPKAPATEANLESPPVRRPHYMPGKAKAVPELLNLRYDDAFYRQMALLSESEDNTRNHPPRWTLTADGTLQRSLDGGISWKRIQVAQNESHVFRAVSAAGQSIWLGGERGVLFHSSDAGRHWTEIKQTGNRSLPNSDITGIQFEDELHGKLTTASNESWMTSDAGHTWEKK